MNRTEWTRLLAEAIRPTAAKAATTQIGQLMRLLSDVPETAFTEDSVRWVAERKPGHALTLAWLRDTLGDYQRSLAPPPAPMPRDEPWDERQAFLRRDWDDPAGILRKVNVCGDSVSLLRLLGFTVARWAPQHLGLIPPHILESIARDPEVTLPVLVELRNRLPPQEQTPRQEQINSLFGKSAAAPRAYHLDPGLLDQLNPLPDGRKRV